MMSKDVMEDKGKKGFWGNLFRSASLANRGRHSVRPVVMVFRVLLPLILRASLEKGARRRQTGPLGSVVDYGGVKQILVMTHTAVHDLIRNLNQNLTEVVGRAVGH